MDEQDIRQLLIGERAKRGWSQEAVSLAMGYKYATGYSIYESPNGASPTLNILQRAAQVYDMDLVIEFRPKVDERIAALEGK